MVEANSGVDSLIKENTDKDKRIAELEKALEEMVFAYINKDEDCPHSFEIDALKIASKVGNDNTRKFSTNALKGGGK